MSMYYKYVSIAFSTLLLTIVVYDRLFHTIFISTVFTSNSNSSTVYSQSEELKSSTPIRERIAGSGMSILGAF